MKKLQRKHYFSIILVVAFLTATGIFIKGIPNQLANATTQNTYRWRNDTGSESLNSNWTANENTPISGFTQEIVKVAKAKDEVRCYIKWRD